MLHESLVMEHERDAMSWRSEWIALPEICLYLSSQLKSMLTVLEGLVVKPENMLKNLERLGGLILSERVMFALSEKIGKQTAHHLIYEIAMESAEQKIPFKRLLGQNEKVAAVLTEEQINQLLDPSQYIGLASEKVDEVIASIRNGGLLSE